ncbi:hypothetical protein FWG76_00425 [Candidatus Saccharibacteria bacterium]|nr:hypothetical protein [Candidatus Saccharibacteria bacterium]
MVKSQLGVNNINAIINGALANNALFFGASNTEITSTAMQQGAWNSGRAITVSTGGPWAILGGTTEMEVGAGIFTYSYTSGNPNWRTSHRTILLGY